MHLSCHAYFESSDPLSSSIRLTDENKPTEYKDLTLEDVFLHIHFPKTYLVVLSTCKTGMVKPGFTDEFVSFPAGFLHAGAPAVICSLWPVNGYSTSLLMQRFYENIKKKGMNRVDSLKEAQLWFIEEERREEIIESAKQVESISQEKILREVDLSHPYYWSAFCCFGIP